VLLSDEGDSQSRVFCLVTKLPPREELRMVDKYWDEHGAPFHGCLRAAVANSLKLILFFCVTSLSLMAATLPPGFSETQIAGGLTHRDNSGGCIQSHLECARSGNANF
jgi:hypothetical protein